MLFTLQKHALRIESHLFKRFFFYSATLNTELKHGDYILKPDDNLELRKERRQFLKVAILGLPNAGKSTLINALVHRAVCPAASKVHTTVHKTEAIYSEGDTQIVFMDTPGLASNSEMKKYKLAETFTKDVEISIAEADVIGILQDVCNVYTRHTIPNFVLQYLKNKRESTPLLLIFNKVDKLKKKDVLLDLTRTVTTNKDLPKFDDTFMISALTGDGVDDLRNYLLDSAKECDWQYEKETIVDQPLRKLIEETVRAAALEFLLWDIPYNIRIQLEHMDVGEDGTISTSVEMECHKGIYLKHLLHNKGENVKSIARLAEQRLQHALRTRVILLICAKKKPTQV